MTHNISLSHPAIKILAVATVGAVCSFWFGLAMPVRVLEAQSRIQPFRLDRTVWVARDGEALRPFRKETIARRGDGTTATVNSIGPLAESNLIRSVQFLDGRVVSILDRIGARSTWQNSNAQELSQRKALLLAAPPDCGAREPYKVIGFEKVGLIDTVVVQRLIPGRYRVTRRLAPRLGCEDVAYYVEALKADGSVAYVSADAKLDELALEEPDGSLFDIPPGFTELKPSEAQRRFQRSIGMSMSAEEQRQADREGQLADLAYQRRSGN